MKKIRKQVLAVLLAVVMVAGAPASLHALAETYPEIAFTYEIDPFEHLAYITGLQEDFPGGVMHIPSAVEGAPIVAIDPLEIALSKKVTGFTVDADNAFFAADASGVLFDQQMTTLIAYPSANSRAAYMVPDTVQTISDGAFFFSTNLQYVMLPQDLMSIYSLAFCGCTGLQEIVIPESVEDIKDGAFLFCTGIDHFEIPASVIEIGETALATGGDLQTIDVDPDNGAYIVENDVLFDADKTMLIQYPAGKADSGYVIPDGVEYVSSGAFLNAAGLEYVHVPDSVEMIGDYAFADVTSSDADDLIRFLYRGEADAPELYLCCESASCAAADYADTYGLAFRVCDGDHGADADRPTGTISGCTNDVSPVQTVTLRLSDSVGVAGYYWGTSAQYDDNPFVATTIATARLTVASAGTYYLTVLNTSGRRSLTSSVTFYETTLDADGGETAPATVLTKQGNAFTPPTPVRSGYAFVAWFGDDDEAIAGDYTPQGSAVLKAGWTPLEEGGWRFAEDTTLHIHETANGKQFVTGLDPDDPWVSPFVETTGGWTATVELNDQDTESTGAVLQIFDDAGELRESYEIVLFGDVDGNSVIDGMDTMTLKDVVNRMGSYSWMFYDETDDNARIYAADVDHTYVVDGQDVMMLKDSIGFLKPCNQNWTEDGDPVYR